MRGRIIVINRIPEVQRGHPRPLRLTIRGHFEATRGLHKLSLITAI